MFTVLLYIFNGEVNDASSPAIPLGTHKNATYIIHIYMHTDSGLKTVNILHTLEFAVCIYGNFLMECLHIN